MRRNFIKSLVVLAISGMGMAQAATVTLAAGSAQTATLLDPAGSGKQVTLSVPSGGGTHLEFSNGTGVVGGIPTTSIGGLTGLLNILYRPQIIGADGAAINFKMYKIGRVPQRGTLSIDANISAVTLESGDSSIVFAESSGGFLMNNPYLDGLSDGGIFQIRKVRIDFQKRQILGDLTKMPLLYDATRNEEYFAVPTITKNAVMWTFDAPYGNVKLPISALADKDLKKIQDSGYQLLPNGLGGCDIHGNIVLPNLKITNLGLKIFTEALGASPGSTTYVETDRLNTLKDNWGSMVLTTKFSPASPIPCSP